MKLAILSALVAGAAAFAPTQEAKQTTALAAFENEREFVLMIAGRSRSSIGGSLLVGGLLLLLAGSSITCMRKQHEQC